MVQAWPWQVHNGTIKLFVRATANAAKNEIIGLHDSGTPPVALKVKVTAIREKNKANKAIIELLAKALSVPKSAITLVSGASERLKVFTIDREPESIAHKLKQLVRTK